MVRRPRSADTGDHFIEPVLKVMVDVEELQFNDLITLVVGWLKVPFHQQAVWLEFDRTPETR